MGAGSLRAEGVEPKVLKYNGFCCREAALDLAKQPTRLLVAGACDAMTKKIEIEFWNSLPGAVGNPVACGIASFVSDYIYGELDMKLDAAVEDLRKDEPTQTLQDVIFSTDSAATA